MEKFHIVDTKESASILTLSPIILWTYEINACKNHYKFFHRLSSLPSFRPCGRKNLRRGCDRT